MGLFGDFVSAVSSVTDAVGDAVSGAADAVVGAVAAVAQDAGNAVASAASAVADAAEAVLDTAADVVEDAADVVSGFAQEAAAATAEAVCVSTSDAGVLGDVLCAAANVAAGVVNGATQAIEDFVDDGLDLIRDAGDVVFSVVRLDFGGALDAAVELVADAGELGLDVVRYDTGGYLAGEVVEQFQRKSLRDFVSAEVDARFPDDAAGRARIRAYLNLDAPGFGLPLRAEHRVFRLDSAEVDLTALHASRTLDLFVAAGLGPNLDVFPRPRMEVVRVDAGGTDQRAWPVNRSVIQAHLDSGGADHRLRVYAIERPIIAANLRRAEEACRQLGIKLTWNDPTHWARFSEFTAQPVIADDVRFAVGDDSVASKASEWLVDHGLRTGAETDERKLLALAVFRFVPDERGTELNGVTAGRDIKEGPEAARCPTPGRTDSCCVTPSFRKIRTRRDLAGSAVFYRDLVVPEIVWGHVLAHEVGHWLGLCHYGHDGVDHIMFSNKANTALSVSDLNWLMYSTPRFTAADAENTWRFILTQLPQALAP